MQMEAHVQRYLKCFDPILIMSYKDTRLSAR